MSIASLAKSVEKFSADNSPMILTAIGVAGTITTAILSAKAGIQAHGLVVAEEQSRTMESEPFRNVKLDAKTKVQLTWKVWVIPASVGTVTCTSIIMANRIGTRRAAAMATAYMVTTEAFDEYKHKVVEKLGETKERQIHDEVAQDRMRRVDSSHVVIGEGKVLCFDQYTGRYFDSTVESIKKAMNDTNYEILQQNSASLSSFYDRIGLPPTSFSEEFGWSSDKPMDILFSTTLAEDGKPAVSIDFTVKPIRDYYKFL
jgi:hypothetical protein